MNEEASIEAGQARLAEPPGASALEVEHHRTGSAREFAAYRRFADRRSRLILGLLWLVLLAQGVFFALLQPVWSRVDEAQHFHYVQYLVENRALPVEGQTFISPEVVGISLKANQWGWRPAGSISTPALLDSSQWSTVPEGLSDQERERWVRRNLWYFNYEAMQPPLYYLVNAPLYAALPGDSLTKLYGLRLLAALLASTMLPLAYFTAREAFPDSRLVVWGTAVTVLLIQGYALNMSQMTNDALAVPLAASAILLLLRLVGRGLTMKRSLLAGAAVGASLLAKMTTIFLIPVSLAALAVLLIFRRESGRRLLGHAALIFAPVALLLSPLVLHNLAVYGDATGASAARPLMSSFFKSPLTSLQTLRLEELMPTFWFGEPIFPFSFWSNGWLAISLLIGIALLGLGYRYWGEGESTVPEVRLRLTFMMLVLGIGLAVNLLIPFGSGIGGVPGRYLYPLIPTVAFAIVLGLDRFLRRDRARFVAELVLVWLIFWESLNLLAYIQNR